MLFFPQISLKDHDILNKSLSETMIIIGNMLNTLCSSFHPIAFYLSFILI